MEGYVYILVNSSFPNLVKIGRTTKSPTYRAQELSSTGTPGKFVVAYSVLVKNCIDIESEIHKYFSEQRHTLDREFFEIDSTIAINKLIEITKNKVISEKNNIIEFATFYMIKISNFRNFYRIGLIDKEVDFLKEVDFKKKIIDLYTQIEPAHFYDCVVIRYETYTNIESYIIEEMQRIIDINLKTIRKNNRLLFDTNFNKFDERTLVFKDVESSFLMNIFESCDSLISPIVNASKQKKINQEKLNSENEKKIIFDNKLRQIDIR